MADHPVLYNQLAFLPWLRLARVHEVGGVSFVPLVAADRSTPAQLLGAVDSLKAILASYIDRDGKPIDNCVVAVMPGRGWNLADEDFDAVQSATSLLFLGSWAGNDYFPRFLGSYVNSSSFRLVWQRFTGTPEWVSLVSRRRDGRNLDGGRKHGEVKFSVPLQCNLRNVSRVDEGFLRAFDVGADSASRRRLRFALPFVTLGNTDDDLITESAEAILMGSAFEQMLAGGGTAFKLGRKFGGWFGRFGGVTVGDAQIARPGIEIDTSKPEYALAQPQWWVHRKWMEELYDLRSRSAHRGTTGGRTWGWSAHEHLLMAAWVFPLVVKLLFEAEGCYEMTEVDTGHCLAVDRLLSIVRWDEEPGNCPHRWHEVVSDTVRHHRFDEIMRRVMNGAVEAVPDLSVRPESARGAREGEGAQ